MATIEQIDVRDDRALLDWYDVEAASVALDRPDASHRSYANLAAAVQHPNSRRRYILLAARQDGATVGTADLTLRDAENTHALELEIHVHPDHRRRGLGRHLWEAAALIGEQEGRGTFLCEVTTPPAAGLAFARTLGFASVHEEDHLALSLPHDVDPIATPGYEIVTWIGPCPDEYLAGYVRLRNQMGEDVPSGEVDLTAIVYTEERIREEEERNARSFQRITSAAREEASGELVGYSLVFLAKGSANAIQDDTLVMPQHRGHRLGHALKRATLEIICRDYPERTRLHTYTAPDNAPMQATNAAFGYRLVDHVHEVQLTR